MFGAAGVFQKTHLDFLARDGSVICSSVPVQAPNAGYGGSAWFSAALAGPTFAGPIPDPRTGATAAVSAAPVPGRGVVAGFVDLAGLGPVLGSRFAGPYHFRVLIATLKGLFILPGDGRDPKEVDRQLRALERLIA